MASAGGQLRALNRLRAEALGDFAIGIDASLSLASREYYDSMSSAST